MPEFGPKPADLPQAEPPAMEFGRGAFVACWAAVTGVCLLALGPAAGANAATGAGLLACTLAVLGRRKTYRPPLRKRGHEPASPPAPQEAAEESNETALPRDTEEGQIRATRLALLNIIFDLENKERQLSEAREQLRRSNSTLEQRVRQRTREVETLLEQKEQFVRQLGHDLRTPLTPLLGLLPLIRSRPAAESFAEPLDLAISNVRYMHRLVDNTLELARLGAGQMVLQKQPLPLRAQVRELLKTMAEEFHARNMSCQNRLDEDLEVYADPTSLSEILQNLLSNAIKYAGRGQIILTAVRRGSHVRISVSDSGQGMTEEQLSRIFEEFYKADASRHDRGSTGLGLSICRRLVEAHGGSIWAESDGPGKGTTVHFTLPLAEKAHARQPEELADAHPPR
jgi:signal transduction histidine kinase